MSLVSTTQAHCEEVTSILWVSAESIPVAFIPLDEAGQSSNMTIKIADLA